MSDPNAIYKESFRALQARLGRLPTAAEILPLNIAYARSWAPAEETVLAPNAAAGRPAPAGFSRQPAPQARAVGAGTRTREGQESGTAAGEPLSGPDKSAEAEAAVSEPPAPPAPPRNYDGLAEGDRGPSGGLVGKCVKCGRLWERPTRAGRPSYRCGGCR